MRNRLTEIKINTRAITETSFKSKMDITPAFFLIKFHESKIYCDDLAVYISEEDAEKIGFRNLTEIVNDYNFMFNNRL